LKCRNAQSKKKELRRRNICRVGNEWQISHEGLSTGWVVKK
jgi:hypothetical protein